jgi:hypothetical protein
MKWELATAATLRRIIETILTCQLNKHHVLSSHSMKDLQQAVPIQELKILEECLMQVVKALVLELMQLIHILEVKDGLLHKHLAL